MVKRLLLLVIVLAACTPQATPAPTVDVHNPPTVPAPAYVEAAAPITLDNVAQVSYLGRLDQPGSPTTILAHAFSPDGTRLVALSNQLVLAWNLVTGELLSSTAREAATSIFVSSDKTEIYTIGDDGIIHVYDMAHGQEQTQFRAHTQFNGTIDFYADTGWLALGGRNGEVKVWDTYERTSMVTIQASAVEIQSIAFSPDGSLLAVAADDGLVRLWDWKNRTKVAEFDHNGARTLRMAFSPDGNTLAVGTSEYIAMWSVPDKSLIFALQSGAGGVSEVLKFSPNGRYLLSGGVPANMTLWVVETGEVAALLPGMGGDRSGAAFSPNGDLLVTARLYGSTALWDMTTITNQTVNRADISAPSNTILTADWTEDGYLITLFDANGSIYVFGIGPQPASGG